MTQAGRFLKFFFFLNSSKKKNLFDFISLQTRPGQIEKEKKKEFHSRYHFFPTQARAFPKKLKNEIGKKLKKLKTSFRLHILPNRVGT